MQQLVLVCVALLVLVQVAMSAALCNENLRTKVAKGEVLGDGSLRSADGTIFPKNTFWQEGEFWWACPCLAGQCVRLCSEGLANATESQLKINLLSGIRSKKVLVWEGDEQKSWVDVNRHFSVVREANCPNAFPLQPENDDWDKHKLFANGTLYFEHPNISKEYKFSSPEHFCIIPRDRVEQIILSCNYERNPPIDIKYRIYPPFFILSAIFLLLTLAAFFLTPDHKTLHGRSVVCQSGILLVMYIGLTVNYLTGAESHISICIATTYVTYYSLLASFFWLNIMCIDIYLTFRSVAHRGEVNFILPSLYAWGVPALFLVVTLVLDMTTSNELFSPGIGTHSCWFQGVLSELIYFNGPVLALLVVNAVLFGSTAARLWRLKKESRKMLRGGDSRVHLPEGHSQKDKDRLTLYVKLFLLMGGTWFMEIISWAAGGPSSIWFITDTINSLRGVLIFWFCVWSNKAMRLALKDRFFPNRPILKVAVASNTKSDGSSLSTASTDP